MAPRAGRGAAGPAPAAGEPLALERLRRGAARVGAEGGPRVGESTATASAPKLGPDPQKQPLQLCPAPAAAAVRVGAEFSAKETGRRGWPCAGGRRAAGTAEAAACGGDLGA